MMPMCEKTLNPKPELWCDLQIIDANYFFTAAFTIEVLLQSIAKNFILGPNGMPHCPFMTMSQ